MLTAALEPPRGGEGDGSARGGDMSGCPSQQHWRRPLTTAFRRVGGQKRTKPHGDRRPAVHRRNRGGSRPDRLAGVRPQERVQRHTMEHIVDSALVVPTLDAPVPLMAEQLVDVLSLIAKYEKEIDRIEDLILVVPLSTLLTGRLAGVGPRAPPLPQFQRGRIRRGGRGHCQKRQYWVAPFSDVLEALEIPKLQSKLEGFPVLGQGGYRS